MAEKLPVPRWVQRSEDWVLHAGAFTCRVFKTESTFGARSTFMWKAEMTFGGFTTTEGVLLDGRAVEAASFALEAARVAFISWIRSMTEYAPHALSILEG